MTCLAQLFYGKEHLVALVREDGGAHVRESGHECKELDFCHARGIYPDGGYLVGSLEHREENNS